MYTANWSSHEKSKKAQLVHDSASTEDLGTLLAQVHCLKPTAIACPPNIWSGLQRLALVDGQDSPAYHQRCRAIAASFGDRVAFTITGGAPIAESTFQFL